MNDEKKPMKKLLYVLRIRLTDFDQWSDPSYFLKRKDRDKCASMNRIIGGMRTHCYEERIDPASVEINED